MKLLTSESNDIKRYEVNKLKKGAMMPLFAYITHYWGKAQPAGEGISWHPLAYHSLDVAAAMEALLQIRPRWLKDLAKATGLDRDEVQKRLLIVAALHDLGKFAENFQSKVPELFKRHGHSLLHEKFGTEFKNEAAGHGRVGQKLWEDCRKDLGLTHLDSWMHAGFSHHGTPVDALDTLPNAMSPKSIVAAQSYVDEILAIFGQPSDAKPDKRKYEHWRIAGLVILADWIGSNQNWFPYTRSDYTLEQYWKIARKRAQKAMTEANLAEAKCATQFDLQSLLGKAAVASPLQQWAENQSPEGGPQLYIIEDLTGAGKTEAALILAHRLIKAGAAEGLYWALPSMATANGLYERLEKTYQSLFDVSDIKPSLVLAHSARDLHDVFQSSIQNGKIRSYKGTSDQDESAEATCASFYAEDRKKTFLAQVGIGTLDQALLGALPVRHQSLRLVALSRRVLVIDEAHAYDPYMTKGLEALLKFQKLMGGSSIILSATLTQAQKQLFARAYGADEDDLTETAFPLTTHISTDGRVEQTAPESKRGTRRDLKFRRFDTAQEVMDALLEKARLGFACVYIRNTVKEAMEAYDYLKQQHDQVDIFHARFCLSDRIVREKAILHRFGKSSTPEARRGQILVATQVVEQSLDLDFDFMATDLCPIDLIIQRAGRLHRHNHRPQRPDPELWVVSDSADDNATADWYAKLFKSGQYVYPHIGQLWRTMRELEAQGGLNLLTGSPRDLIEPVFEGDISDIPEPLQKASLKAEGEDSSERGIGALNFLKSKDFTPSKESWAKDVHTPTRLGEPTTTIRLARWSNGVLKPWADSDDRSWRLSEMSIRSHLCQQTLSPDPACAKAIESQMAEWNARYDPPQILALVPTDQDGVWTGKWQTAKGETIEMSYSTLGGLQY